MGKAQKDSLGDRMKGFYEDAYRICLPRRMPMIIRLDGKAFHTLTRGLEKPWDRRFVETMARTAEALCKEVGNCKLAYVQSDEISLLCLDYDKLETEAWFGRNLQKMVSVSAGLATKYFNEFAEVEKLDRTGTFDARAFVLPVAEVANYFLWRQQDCVRNSIQGLAQAKFSHKELQGLSCNKLQEKLFRERGINWGEDVPTHLKRGICVEKIVPKPDLADLAPRWTVNYEIPRFEENRYFIERHLEPKSEPQPAADKDKVIEANENVDTSDQFQGPRNDGVGLLVEEPGHGGTAENLD